MYKYAYIIGTLFFVPLFILIFTKRKGLRTEMLSVGLIGGVIAFITGPYFVSTEWHPETLLGLNYSIEDFIFTFLFCSQTSVLYAFIAGKRLDKTVALTQLRHEINKNKRRILTVSSLVLFGFFACFFVLGLNAIYASILSTLISVIVILYLRKDLIYSSLITGLIFLIYAYIFYFIFTHLFVGIISGWWNLKALSGILLMGTPIEEFLWFVIVAMFCSAAYKFSIGAKYQ